ncbi:1-acyl-sn-glycerol-3-phosphate acyltransferase [Mycoplasmopsis gallinarum]|uniref:1-acyl-sn-glycerol-3-phosphate acyltransferase n=1 Tax=Mycoplasmopsis gallinarum TaxID=29557 RepID=UPI00047F6EA4|nr:1-acyl-sn-glycerol-3-phosphate acyltransferase [Mycoplasmopsis gallinarum]
MKINKYQEIINEKELNGLFNEPIDTFGFKEKNIRKVNENHKFWKNKWYSKIYSFFMRAILKFASFFIKIWFLNQIKGKNNYKKLKNQNFIAVSNHCLYLDNLLIRDNINKHKFFILAKEDNNVKGTRGRMLQHGGMFPIPSNPRALIKMKQELKVLLESKKRNFILIFAEKEMWHKYIKPRPTVNGAYNFAYDFNKPILPVFLEIKKYKNSDRVKRVVTHFLEPIYPNNNLDKSENIEMMKNNLEKQWIDKYYEIFKISKNQNLYKINSQGFERLNEHPEFQKQCNEIQVN